MSALPNRRVPFASNDVPIETSLEEDFPGSIVHFVAVEGFNPEVCAMLEALQSMTSEELLHIAVLPSEAEALIYTAKVQNSGQSVARVSVVDGLEDDEPTMEVEKDLSFRCLVPRGEDSFVTAVDIMRLTDNIRIGLITRVKRLANELKKSARRVTRTQRYPLTCADC